MIHYDTAKDREEHADELHHMLEHLSVEMVPTIIFRQERTAKTNEGQILTVDAKVCTRTEFYVIVNM